MQLFLGLVLMVSTVSMHAASAGKKPLHGQQGAADPAVVQKVREGLVLLIKDAAHHDQRGTDAALVLAALRAYAATPERPLEYSPVHHAHINKELQQAGIVDAHYRLTGAAKTVIDKELTHNQGTGQYSLNSVAK